MLKPHFPSYQRLVNRGGDPQSAIGTLIISGLRFPLVSLICVMVIMFHFGLCRGISNLHLKLLTVKTTNPDSTIMFVSNGIVRINAFTPSNLLTKILFLSASDLRKSIGFSWYNILHSRFVELPMFHAETSDCDASTRSMALLLRTVPSTNVIDDPQPILASSSDRLKNPNGLGFWLVTISANAEADAIDLFNGSFLRSLAAVIPAITTSPKTPTITAFSPHFFAEFQNLKDRIGRGLSLPAHASTNNPATKTIPEMHAQNTGQKYDWVVVSIYSLLGIVTMVSVTILVVLIKDELTSGK
jgi:hypothetical protein